MIEMDGEVIGFLGSDGKMNYNTDQFQSKIQEIVAGQSATGKGGFVKTSVRVIYKWDRSRDANNNAIFNLWKRNPIVQNRVRQLNSLIFGRGFTYAYEDSTQAMIDRFWRVNRFRSKLNALCTDAQLYGEVFIGLFPQSSGDVLATVYESNQVDIDFDPANIDNVREYVVGYRDEELGKDVNIRFRPVYQYLNEMELSTSPMTKVINKVKSMVGGKKIAGYDGAMIHIRFNNSSTEVHGTSDFRQVFPILNEYMDFRADRLSVHSLYGSPMFDISIDTEDPNVIANRIEELAQFTIGSNPVHNNKEKWTPMEFKHNADSAKEDERAMRGLLCAGTGFPEHLLFNQGAGNDDGTFSLNKIAEDMQDAFGDAFKEMHKFVLSVAGMDMSTIDGGQIVFPEISTMSEKAKAETYVLKVGAKICSRKTAAMNTGHNWFIEEGQILKEFEQFGSDNDYANALSGIMGGRFSNKGNRDGDDGSDDKNSRQHAGNITTQTFGNRKQND